MESSLNKNWLSDPKNTKRFVILCDGIFAIAITLLITQIDIPARLREGNPFQDLLSMWPEFLSYAISFFVLARFWFLHLNLFSFVKKIDVKLLAIGMLFMSMIAFVPFTTDLYGEHHLSFFALSLYVIEVALTGIVSYFMWHYVKNSRELLHEGVDLELIKRRSYRSLFLSFEFIIPLLLIAFIPGLISWFWLIFAITAAVFITSQVIFDARGKSGV